MLLIVFCALPALSSSEAFAQAPGDSAQVILLSERVGPVIDRVEMEKFHIFGHLQRAEQAVVVQLPRGSFAALVTLAQTDGSTADTLIAYPEVTLLLMAEKIDHFEEIEDAKYSMSSTQPVLLRSGQWVGVNELRERSPLSPIWTSPNARADTVSAKGRTASSWRPVQPGLTKSRVATFSRREGYPRERSYPLMDLTLGMRTIHTDTKGMEKLFQNQDLLHANLLVSVGLEILFSDRIGLNAEGGSAIDGNAAADAAVFTAGPVVYFPIPGTSTFKPFLGGGYSSISMKDLEGDLHMSAGAKGYYVTGGLGLVLGSGAAFELTGTYLKYKRVSYVFHFPVTWTDTPSGPVAVEAHEPVYVSLNMSHFSVGLRLKLYQ